MRGKLALIVVTLVAAPAVVLVVAHGHQATPGIRVEKEPVKQYVAEFQFLHPGATCTVTSPVSASCITSNGSATDLVVGTTDVASTP